MTDAIWVWECSVPSIKRFVAVLPCRHSYVAYYSDGSAKVCPLNDRDRQIVLERGHADSGRWRAVGVERLAEAWASHAAAGGV